MFLSARSLVLVLSLIGFGLQSGLPVFAAKPIIKPITPYPVIKLKTLPKVPTLKPKIDPKTILKHGPLKVPGNSNNPTPGNTPTPSSGGGSSVDETGYDRGSGGYRGGGGYSYGGGRGGSSTPSGFGGGSGPENAPTNAVPLHPVSTGSLLGGKSFTFSAATVSQQSVNKDDESVESDEITFATADIQQARELGQKLAVQGYPVIRRSNLPSLGFWISTVRVRGRPLSEVVEEFRNAYPDALFALNDRYGLLSTPRVYATNLIGWNPKSNQCGSRRRIGMIDTTVDQNHPALRSSLIEISSLLTSGTPAAAADHGTAVATLLVGHAVEGNQIGLLPQSRLHVINVFRQRDKKHVDTTAELIIRAIDTLVGKSVDAINLSFGGASNPILEVALRSAIKGGVFVVAAAGNGGAQSGPVYPAAYPGVIAVTAVDAQKQIYAKATQGEYISFAAPGVDVWTAASGGRGSYSSGTSFAVPFVTAVVVTMRSLYPQETSEALQKRIADSALDLGKPGRDAVYGWGLVQTPRQCAQVVSQ